MKVVANCGKCFYSARCKSFFIAFAGLTLKFHLWQIPRQLLNLFRPPTWDDRLSTPYTEAVIHEVQRCGNVLPFSVTHTAQRDTSLGQGGRRHLIPAGTNAFINIGRVMKDPAHFPEPEKFDPSRYVRKLPSRLFYLR